MELSLAMQSGHRVLLANKGERPKPESENGKKKKSSKKKKPSKKKKNDKDQELRLAIKNWDKIVDAYGVADEVTAKYPKEKPDWITLRGMKVPAKLDILIIAKHDGTYVTWIQHAKRRIKNARTRRTSSSPRCRAPTISRPLPGWRVGRGFPCFRANFRRRRECTSEP